MVHKHRDVLQLLMILFLCFSFLVSFAAVPVTRSLLSQSSIQTSTVDLGQEFVEGRMDLESTDYPGTGANNNHDPKTPGTA
ncbi:Transmembrane protein [Quillaja saponaria]|uniref:Transmembrane protein n=1 Tax=Quillaja saponaria TaxID=32244 RepID=A0AAD7Q7S6_QUISA|nr:Transmembrane protein [Quillaja saponaria]